MRDMPAPLTERAMPDDQRVLQLLEEALESGGPPDAVCGDRPDLLPEVRRRWQECRRVEAELDVLFPPSSVPAADRADRRRRGVRPWAELPLVPGYEVEKVLGRGGVGVVYKARHLRLRRPVAIKMLLSGAYAGRVEVARFMQEARAVAGLRHPHVVQVFDVGECEGLPFYTMELVEGGTLAERLGGVPQRAGPADRSPARISPRVRPGHRSSAGRVPASRPRAKPRAGRHNARAPKGVMGQPRSSPKRIRCGHSCT